MKFKVNDRVKYLGGCWEPMDGPFLKVGGVYIVNYVGRDNIKLDINETRLRGWHYYAPKYYFIKIGGTLSDKIRII